MIRNFQDTLILTSQNPETFVNFIGEGSIGFVVPIANIPLQTVYINGLDASFYKNSSIGYYIDPCLGGIGLGVALNVDVCIASFLISTKSLSDFNYRIRFQLWDSSKFTVLYQTFDVSVLNRVNNISNDINTYDNLNMQIENEASYLILRTNPKFTGNIKVVTNESNEIFLDTFKVSKNLSDKKYRKQSISASSVLSSDIYKTFNTLPTGDLYQIHYQNLLDVKLPKTSYNEQYVTTYNYGARLFEDNLYEEDYALLAPIWINKKLPDYFAIFKLTGTYNQVSYTTGSLSNLASDFLKDSSLIKSWSFKTDAPLGQYFRNYQEELLPVRSPVFLSLSDPNSVDYDPNTWYGIAVDKGVIAGRSETTYRFNQQNNLTDLSWFVSQGFERNNLLCPNLVNMEYIFSDEDAEMYTMSRYFGLYLTENPLYEIAYYSSEPTSSISILPLDDKDINIFFDSSVFDQTYGNIQDDYSNRIFTIDDILSVKRITNFNQINGNTDFISEWQNKLGTNLFSAIASKEEIKPFITLNLNRKLVQGEHLRIINKTRNIIWEAFSIDSPHLSKGEAWPYTSTYSSGRPTIHHTAFSIKGEISDQILAIQKAFETFKDYDGTFEKGIRKSSSISFTLTDNYTDEWLFQRITADTVDVPTDPNSPFNRAANPDDIGFYGIITPNATDFSEISIDSSYGPINFEIYGKRKSLTINFIDTSMLNIYSIDSSCGDNIEYYTMYRAVDEWNRLIHRMNVDTMISFDEISIDASLSLTNFSYASLVYVGATQSYTASAIGGGESAQSSLFNALEGSINIRGDIIRNSGTLNVELVDGAGNLYLSLLSGLTTDISMNENIIIPSDVSLRIKYVSASPGLWYFQKPTITKYYKIGSTDVGNLYTSNYVEDPVNIEDKIIVFTEKEIQLVKNKWNAYAVYPLVVSLMGINAVKDIDYTVYDRGLGFISDYFYKREDDLETYSHTIPISTSENINIKNSFYITSGSGRITIDGCTLAYSIAIDASPFVFNTFNYPAAISTTTDTVVSYAIPYTDKTFKSYTADSNEELLENYYAEGSTYLKYPLTVPYVSKWVGMGYDARNNPIRLFTDASYFDIDTGSTPTNFIPYGDQYNDEIGFASFKYLTPEGNAWKQYIFYDTNDVVEDASVLYTMKDLMLAKPNLDVFSKLLYSNKGTNSVFARSTIAYYNSYKNSIDFILSGVNFSLKVESIGQNFFNVQDYNQFRVSLITTPSRNRNYNRSIEVIINENTKTILLIWYQGNDVLNFTQRYSDIVSGKNNLYVDGSNNVNYRGFRNYDPLWTYIKTPFSLNTANIATLITNIYGTSMSYDPCIFSPYAQLNLNKFNGASSIYNAYSSNSLITGGFNDNQISYDTFEQYIRYVYSRNRLTYSDDVVNYGFNYVSNQNIYKNLTCDLSTLSYMIGANNVYYYIIKSDKTYTNKDFSVPPLRLAINPPRLYDGLYVYNGWFKPNFKNILEFNFDEDTKITSALEKDFIMSNTYIKSYNNINQLWYNKVVNTVTKEDVSAGNAVHYLHNYNVFKSQWDSNYYELNTTPTSYRYVPGYNASQELPAFFGSKLPKLPASITLDSWDVNTLSYSYQGTKDSYLLKFNISRAITKIFKNNLTFLNNWNGLTSNDTIINNYIATTVLGYYQLEASNINTELYRKVSTDTIPISYTYDNSFTLYNEANVNGTLTKENNEYIYSIRIISGIYKYFVKFTLLEK
jgi:hypothetical protein